MNARIHGLHRLEDMRSVRHDKVRADRFANGPVC